MGGARYVDKERDKQTAHGPTFSCLRSDQNPVCMDAWMHGCMMDGGGSYGFEVLPQQKLNPTQRAKRQQAEGTKASGKKVGWLA